MQTWLDTLARWFPLTNKVISLVVSSRPWKWTKFYHTLSQSALSRKITNFKHYQVLPRFYLLRSTRWARNLLPTLRITHIWFQTEMNSSKKSLSSLKSVLMTQLKTLFSETSLTMAKREILKQWPVLSAELLWDLLKTMLSTRNKTSLTTWAILSASISPVD